MRKADAADFEPGLVLPDEAVSLPSFAQATCQDKRSSIRDSAPSHGSSGSINKWVRIRNEKDKGEMVFETNPSGILVDGLCF